MRGNSEFVMPHVTRESVLLGGLLLLLILVAAPPFLCMELHSDVILFDVYARNLQKGGVAYRDWCETNLPGMAWLHWGLRSFIGWRSEALRAADLGVIGAAVAMLARWFPAAGPRWRAGLALALLFFYLTSSEWCHVQRDPWMLLPVLAALSLRRRWLARPSLARSVGEGMLWGAAFWVKPFVAVPGLFVWLASARLARAERRATSRSILADGLAVLAGGALVGMAGVGWMVASGAWPHFVMMATDWNREYFGYDVTGGRRGLMVAGFLSRSFPWVFVHLAALPIAARDLWRGRDSSATLLGAMYLGWLGQALFLQHLFDYVHLPAVLLGFTVVIGRVASLPNPVPGRLLAALLVAGALVRAPVLLGDRLSAWPQCWAEGSSPAVRERVSRLHKVNWGELQAVADYLRRRDLKDGELTCFNMPTAALYRDLDVEAATRYHFFQNNWLTFRRHRPQIYADLAASRQRFVVVDLRWEGSPRPGPWETRIAFRSGRYVVLELTGAETPAWLEECFDATGVGRSIRDGVSWCESGLLSITATGGIDVGRHRILVRGTQRS